MIGPTICSNADQTSRRSRGDHTVDPSNDATSSVAERLQPGALIVVLRYMTVDDASRRAPHRLGRGAALIALAAVLGLGACGGNATTTSADAPTAVEAPAEANVNESPSGDDNAAPQPTASDAPADGQSLPGYEVAVLGWVPFPFTDWPAEAAAQTVDLAAPPWGLRVEVCGEADAAPDPGAEQLFGFADSAGAFGSEFRSLTTGPLVSPELMTWPEPGSCAEGWVQPNVPVGLQPTTASWFKDWDESVPRLDFPLGDPYQPDAIPIDGAVLAAGEAHPVTGNATWTVHGVSRIPAADPAALVPEGSYLNAGQGYDLPPDGFEWAAVDAEYCLGDDPTTVYEGLGLAVDGWATGIALRDQVNVGPDNLYALPAEGPCQRHLWYAPVSPDATITAVTLTFGAGPWWTVSG
jgi:hypothetical protein